MPSTKPLEKRNKQDKKETRKIKRMTGEDRFKITNENSENDQFQKGNEKEFKVHPVST